MPAENSIKLKLKTYTSTRTSTFTLVKCKLKNEKFTDACMTGGMTYTPNHTNVSKFVEFQLTFPKLI